jgi:DNA-binding transcriptional regulator LsrR (DeoR family)
MKASKKTGANMSKDEKSLKRARVIESMLSEGMTREEAAASLGVTERQLRRLRSKYKKEDRL